jgi:hypothetical protein
MTPAFFNRPSFIANESSRRPRAFSSGARDQACSAQRSLSISVSLLNLAFWSPQPLRKFYEQLTRSLREKSSNKRVGYLKTKAMEIKFIIVLIAGCGVAFLTRFLVALLKEAAVASRRTNPVKVVEESRSSSSKVPKLSRLRVVEQESVRRIAML